MSLGRQPCCADLLPGEGTVKLGFVYLRSTNLISYRTVGPYSSSAPAAWNKMFDWLNRHRLRGVVSRGFGMALDDPRRVAPDQCRYDACIDMPEQLAPSAWENMMPQRLPGGAYVRRRYVGPHNQIGAAVKEMRETWCAAPGIKLAADRPLVEIYLDDPLTCPPEKLRTDLCMPIAFVEGRDVA